MKFIYLSTFVPRPQRYYVESISKNYNFNSADAFSYSVFNGLVDNLGQGFECVNQCPIGVYPFYNKKPYYHTNEYEDRGVVVKSFGFSTLYTYMYYSVYSNILKLFRNSIEANDDLCFVIYSINVPVIKAAVEFRRKYKTQLKIILIVPDLLEDIQKDSLTKRIKFKLFGNINDLYNEIDGFVLLTKAMNERIRTRKPYCIVEGIYNSTEQRIVNSQNCSQIKTIFYSGMLFEKFGVKNLVEAFLQTTNPQYRLQLCGCGELEKYIKDKAKIDDRIEYLGLIPREKVLVLQSRASLLINPRTPELDFTRYSFPSKNIEYMASGTPVLLYELEGIPQEYYQYCFHLSKNELDCNSLCEKIDEILMKPHEELSAFGQQAANFIRQYKNSKKQVEKIIELAKRL